MKNIFKIYYNILIYWILNSFFLIQIYGQSWPCNKFSGNNTGIPNDNSQVFLSENSVAVHPLYPNVVLSANNYTNGGITRISAYVSTNYGVNWTSPYTNGIFDNTSYCDPAAAIDLWGRMYVAYLGSPKLVISRSSDNGANWNKFTITTNSNADKDHLIVDNSCTSQYKGRLYCAWTEGGTIKVSYSSNQGQNWSTVEMPNGTSYCVNLATDSEGKVYMVYPKQSDNWNVFHFARSYYGGESWDILSEINLQNIASNSLSGWGPSMAVDVNTNRIYLVYSGKPQNGNNYDVFIKYSNNGGNTWSSETTINQNTIGDQTFPWISCDPTTGHIACIYYDTREIERQTYISISTNSGNSWCDVKISDNYSYYPQFGIGSDYCGIAYSKGIIYPVWTDRRITGDHRYRSYVHPYYVFDKDLILENMIINSNQVSAKTITARNITISSEANVVFQTLNSIILETGFETEDNCTFTADLFHCQGYYEDKNDLTNIVINKKENIDKPLEFNLFQNYPNPFNPITNILYSLKKDSKVRIIIYNILGQEIKILKDDHELSGYKSVIWDGTNDYGKQVSSGIYFCRLHISNQETNIIKEIKLVIIK